MFRRLKFFGIGSFAGVILLLFIFNKKDTKCSYFPDERVIAEILSKKITMATGLQISEKQLREQILPSAEIDFDKSKVKQQPCRYYLANNAQTKQQIEIELCKDEAKIIKITSIK